MTNEEERVYERGHRMAWRRMLSMCLQELIGTDDPVAGQARWVKEREQAVAVLRRVCGEHGDNDWPEHLFLADVIEKHLERHLPEPTPRP